MEGFVAMEVSLVTELQGCSPKIFYWPFSLYPSWGM